MAGSIKVLIADRQGPYRARIADILRAAPDISVIAEASNCVELVDKALAFCPDIVLIDILPARLDAFHAISRIKEQLPLAKVLILTDTDLREDVASAFACGACGYFLKSDSSQVIIGAIAKAVAGERILSPSLNAEEMLRESPDTEPAKLSERETTVLQMLGEGLTNKEIAEHLWLSESTVKTYIRRILNKLNLKNRRQATAFAAPRHISGRYISEKSSDIRNHPARGKSLGSMPVHQTAPSNSRISEKSLISSGSLLTNMTIVSERKQATILSLRLNCPGKTSKTIEAEKVEESVSECFDMIAEKVRLYDGTVALTSSDSLTALFSVPVTHEHDHLKALYAALAIKESLEYHNLEIKKSTGIQIETRIAINIGTIVINRDTHDLTVRYISAGRTVDVAEKALDLIGAGEIAVTHNIFKLATGMFMFGRLGEVRLEELDQPIEVHQLLGLGPVKGKLHAALLRGFTKFVGRGKEIEALLKAFKAAQAGSAQVVGVVGEAGIGKSRILLELKKRIPVGSYIYMEGSCISNGSFMAYLPFADLLSSYLEISESQDKSLIKEELKAKFAKLDDRLKEMIPPIQDLLSLEVDDDSYLKLQPIQRKYRLFEAVRDFLAWESQNKPLVLVLEDLKWIDKSSEELLSYLIDGLSNMCILLILAYRPEYSHNWASKPYYSQVYVDRLSRAACREMVGDILRDGEIEPRLLNLVIDKTEGNPLFIEEIIDNLRENGSIERRGNEYVLNMNRLNIRVPPMINAILGARVDRLAGDLKQILQVASVIGSHFTLRILQTATAMGTELKGALHTLQGLGFIYQRSLFPEQEYAFKHVITREVVYESLPARECRKIHEAIGQAIETQYADRIEEFYDILALHYKKSHNWDKACKYSKLAGDKMLRIYANLEALKFYRDAIEACKKQAISGDSQAKELETRLATDAALRGLDYPEGSLENLREAEKLARVLDDARKKSIIHAKMGWYYVVRGQAEIGLIHTDKAFEEATKTGDPDLVVPVTLDLCTALAVVGTCPRCAEVASQAISLLERKGRQFAYSGGMFSVNAYPLLLGHLGAAKTHMGEFKEAKLAFEKALKFVSNLQEPADIGSALHLYSCLFWIRGDGKKAASLLRKAITYLEKTANSIQLAASWGNLGLAYLFQRDCQSAAEYVDKGLDMQKACGATAFLANFFWSKGMIDLERGRIEDARSDFEECLRLALANRERWGEGTARIYLGRIWSRSGTAPPGEAVKSIEHGIRIFKEAKMRPWYAQGYLFLGEHYTNIDHRKALQNLKKAESLFSAMGMEYWLAKTRKALDALKASETRTALSNT